MEKKFLKVGKSINFKFNAEGLECDLTPGIVYNINVDRYTDAISLEETSGLSLPSKVYCTQRDERFIDKVINSYNLSESGFTGVMLAGLKGSGKTVMAKVIANKSGLPIINIDKTYVHISLEILQKNLVTQAFVSCLMSLIRFLRITMTLYCYRYWMVLILRVSI